MTLHRPALAVDVPAGMEDFFSAAEEKVARYFDERELVPSDGTLRLGGNRHVLLRGDTLAFEFSQTIHAIYGDSPQADEIFLAIMFDVAHAAGASDARKFHDVMQLSDPIEKLSVGPVYFAYTGFARVVIHPHSNPVPTDDFVLYYRHLNSFEAESWKDHARTKAPESPVCVVSAGYSSGWCSESFGRPLIAVEFACEALGDAGCEFVMAPPHRIVDHVPPMTAQSRQRLHIPRFFGRQEQNRQLRRLAYQDVLTGLANRTMFVELAEQMIRLAERQGTTLGLLYLDLDGFKSINDRHGHAAGDAVLSVVARRIVDSVRESDIACRQGGDEFLVLLSGPGSADNLLAIARKLIATIGRPIAHEGHSLAVGVSVGAIFVANRFDRLDRLLAAADAAMYEAKRSGSNEVRLGRVGP
jgi:diguanylate cyclase (GGDEF)-like protein